MIGGDYAPGPPGQAAGGPTVQVPGDAFHIHQPGPPARTSPDRVSQVDMLYSHSPARSAENSNSTASTASTATMTHDDTLFELEPLARDGEGEVSVIQQGSAIVADMEVGEALPPVIFRMPNTAFGIAMGLAGHSIMWKNMRNAEFVHSTISIEIMNVLNSVCWHLSASVAGFVAVCYIYKMFTSFPLVMAENMDETRCHFFNSPNLIYIMLLIGLPAHRAAPDETLRRLWAPAFCYQVLMTQHIYKAWMFSKRRNFTEAKPQFLMSTVGWFLLANLGEFCQLREAWGIGLPEMCFGAGFILYVDIVIFIFGKLHENRGMRGSPGMFLLIAAPSVSVTSLDLLDDGNGDRAFSRTGEMMLGWVLVLLMLLVRLGPILWQNPAVLGEYWAYVFPIAAATNATIRYASAMDTAATETLAIIMIVMAISSISLVSMRTTFHVYQCFRREYHWRDPLFRMDKYNTGRLVRQRSKVHLQVNGRKENLLN